MQAEILGTELSVDAINSCYGLKVKCGGEITGRIAFKMNPSKIETMQGDGLFAIDKTALFSVPIFGPLSHLLGIVLIDERAGIEQAKSAFCSFRINDGVITTNDFSTSSKSLVYAGSGSVDLNKRSIDMTMRVNARGLLGLIILPLKPFYGMFQFHGTGPLNDTKWEHVMFTKPDKKQEDLLLKAPKAKVVNPE